MRGTQFLASVIHNINSPCHYLLNHLQSPRQIANTPHRHYTNILNTIPLPNSLTLYKKHIHTHLARQAINNRNNNRIINLPPPIINTTEEQLSKTIRVHYSLRCGHHTKLNTYKHRLDNTYSDTCPKCQAGPHTVKHVFEECPSLDDLRRQLGSRDYIYPSVVDRAS